MSHAEQLTPVAVDPETIAPVPSSREVMDCDNMPRSLFSFKTARGNPVEIMFVQQHDLPLQRDVITELPNESAFEPPERIIKTKPADPATPLLAELKAKSCFAYTERSKMASDTSWQTFESTLDQLNGGIGPRRSAGGTIGRHEIESGKALIMVESSPKQLVHAALELGGGRTKRLQAAHLALQRGEATDDSNFIYDALIALKLHEDTAAKSGQAEAVLLQALTGDGAAQQFVAKHVVQLHESNQARIAEEKSTVRNEVKNLRAEGKINDDEQMPLEQLAAVHLTDYKPQIHNGSYTIQSSHDATSGKFNRHTVHFALNHTVRSHMMGNWEQRRYAIVAPLKGLIESNGDPSSLLPVDTFFEASPGEPLVLPEGTTIVHPGLLQAGKLVDRRADGQIVYRDHDFTPDMIPDLLELLGQTKFETYMTLQRDLPEKLGIVGYPAHGSTGFEHAQITQQAWQSVKTVLFGEVNGAGLPINKLLATMSPAEIAGKVTAQAGLDGETAQLVQRRITVCVEDEIATEVRNAVVEQVIAKIGPVKQANEHGWNDWNSSITGAVEELGIALPAHYYTIYHELYAYLGVGGAIQDLREQQITPQEFKTRTQDWLTDNSDKLSLPTLRVLLQMGVI